MFCRSSCMFLFSFMLLLCMSGYPILAEETQPSNSDTEQMTGRQIMDLNKKYHCVAVESSTEVLVLVDRSGAKEVRNMKRYSKDFPSMENHENKLNRSLIVFDEPASIRGTALLSWEQNTRDDDQWLYLPSQHKTHRIASGNKKSYFMGTDFTYEDMEVDDLDEYHYERSKDETVDGQLCFVLMAKPADEAKASKSAYVYRKLWIRQDIYFPLKIEFYGRGDRLIKTLTNHELFKIDGTENAYRARKSIMDNVSLKHKTLKGLKDVDLNSDIADEVFTERYILSEKHIQ